MRILALDVGDRRVGIAVCDEEGLIASPLTVLQRASKAQDFARLAQLVREQEVGFLVVGHPLNEDGSAGPQARRIERYAEALQEALRREGLDLPMVLWDESFSTQRAQEANAVAAAFILQDYVQARQQRASPAADESDF